MSRVKVKKVKISPTIKDEGLAEMFNQMLGAGSVNVTIAYPRYKKIRGLCEQLVKLFELLAGSPFMRAYKDFSAQKLQIEAFCTSSRESIVDMFRVDFSDYEWNLTLVEDELRKQFSEVYENMKKSDLVNTFIVMCDRLVPYKKNFMDLDKLNHRFITSMAGAEWAPFPFTTLNLKHIFSLAGVGENTITFFMTVLNRAYDLSRQLYEEIQSPDIDVDQFVDFIMKNIDEIQKRPELARCRDAFQKIKESVKLLKDRFNGYYRDFISTKDSTIMMQHFIIDVSKNTEANAKVTSQFRTIISYYRKIAQDQITNPKVKMLFDKVNDSFKELERGTENLVNIRESDSNENTEVEDSDPPLFTPVAKSAHDINCETRLREEAALCVVDPAAEIGPVPDKVDTQKKKLTRKK